jgi:hypothetical protein
LERVETMGAKEALVEKYLVAEVKHRHGVAYKFTSPARRSVPDRLCVLPGGMSIFVEVKAAKGTLTKGQVRELDRLTELGQSATVVYCIKDVDDLMEALDEAGDLRDPSGLVDSKGNTL